MKFFICNHCGNLITFVKDAGVPVNCCGEKMTEIIANTTDAAQEKHVPVVTVKCGRANVNVGDVTHPMSDEHYIDFICVETTSGFQIKHLKPTDEPTASFAIPKGDKLEAVYAHCNLHGLWKAN